MAAVDLEYLFPVQKTPIPVGDLKCHMPTSSRCVYRN